MRNYLKFTKEEKEHLKEVNKKLNFSGKPEKNKYSYKEWKQFVKYDYDYSWWCLLDVIIFKLEKMYCYLSRNIAREGQEKDIVSLKETIDLGWKIHDDDYNQKSFKFSEEHIINIVNIYLKTDKYEELPFKTKIEKLKNPIATLEYKRLPFNERMERLEDKQWSKNNKDIIFGSDNAINNWLVEYNNTHEDKLKKEDLRFTYGGAWVNEESKEIYDQMVKDENKQRQKDVDKFFKLIAKNQFKWSD